MLGECLLVSYSIEAAWSSVYLIDAIKQFFYPYLTKNEKASLKKICKLDVFFFPKERSLLLIWKTQFFSKKICGCLEHVV